MNGAERSNKAMSVQDVTKEDIEKAMKYFKSVRSVGELLAYKELLSLGIKEPYKVIWKLIEMGVIEKGEGCYNLVKGPTEEK